MLHISNVISKHLKKNFDYLQFTHLEKIFHADEILKMTFLIVSYFSFMYSDITQYLFFCFKYEFTKFTKFYSRLTSIQI